MSLPVETKQLHVPNLEEVASALKAGLAKNFAEAEVSVVECPDLTQKPFSLSGKGLNGSTKIADVGGPPYLMPFVDKSKIYDIPHLAKTIGLPDAFVVGAGAGPHPTIGTNSELMANISVGKNAVNGSCVSLIEGAGHKLQKLSSSQTDCALMLNMFACQGLPGKVVKIRAKKRTGEDDFIGCLRKALDEKFEENAVGMGGFFRILSGSVKCHVMPCFSATALTTGEQVDNWLKYFEMSAPMTFFSVFVSRDFGFDLRLEHSHGYGENCGGHYHYDVTPDTVEYEAYFNVAETLYRVDRPPAK